VSVFFKAFGFLGLVLIIAGVLMRGRKHQDVFYIFGGILLEVYSLSIGDLIFIVLQLAFTVAAIFDFFKKRTSRKGI